MNEHTNFYRDVFNGWQVKQLGPKPTAELLATVHGLGARPGKQALAIAMGLRDAGVTGSQIIIATGAPQLNKMRGYITDALLRREMVPPASNGHTVYKLALTAKGKQRIERSIKAAEKAAAQGEADEKPAKGPAKARGERKPRQPKVAPVTEPVTTEPANEPALVRMPLWQ
jgi:hypothetical protein